ncbi:MAG: DUF3644 domain-containing protein [Oxalobacter formigenes]|nr:DUF3644 domain-containing protein [Oxalobacter formigenes]
MINATNKEEKSVLRKRKMVQSNLVKNSVAAYFSAIEIHNKPNISYRYETTTLLIINAWELILKAYVKKFIKKKSIYTKDGLTISFNKSIDYVEEDINSKEPKSFKAIRENLLLIENYRNNVVHYYNEQLEPYIFMLTAKAVINYVDFIKKYFLKNILEKDGLFILPLGFKLPFNPEDFLTRKAAKYVSSPESKKFIESMIKIITNLDRNGIDDTIVVGFDIYLKNVKQLNNRDLLVAITSQDKADVNFSKISRVQITNDPSAQKVNLSDEGFMEQYPLKYIQVCERCKEAIKNFKQGRKFHKIIASIKKQLKIGIYKTTQPQ